MGAQAFLRPATRSRTIFLEHVMGLWAGFPLLLLFSAVLGLVMSTQGCFKPAHVEQTRFGPQLIGHSYAQCCLDPNRRPDCWNSGLLSTDCCAPAVGGENLLFF